MDIGEMKRTDFDDLPFRKNWAEEVVCDSIVILPTRRKHDSGYRVMDFVACLGNEPVCRLSGCSDVIHIDGIGGFGWAYHKKGDRQVLLPRGWSIDCLWKSGLLRLFCSSKTIICGSALSSFEVWSGEREKAKRP